MPLKGRPSAEPGIPDITLFSLWSKAELRAISKDFSNSKENSQKFYGEFRILIESNNPGFPDLYQFMHITLVPGSGQKWIAEAKWEDLKGILKIHILITAWDSPKHTGKLTQDLLESNDKAFPQKADESIIQSYKQTKRWTNLTHLSKTKIPFCETLRAVLLLNVSTENTLPHSLMGCSLN